MARIFGAELGTDPRVCPHYDLAWIFGILIRAICVIRGKAVSWLAGCDKECSLGVLQLPEDEILYVGSDASQLLPELIRFGARRASEVAVW